MDQTRYLHLLGERRALQQMISDTPEADVIDRGSLVARLAAVESELSVQPPPRVRARARLTFRGRPVAGSHGIVAEFGAAAVAAFTDAVAAIGASRSMPLAASGPLPHRDQYQLLITNTALGSFGFELEEPVPAPQLFDEPSPVAQALEQTQTLLRATLGTDEELADSAVEVDPRALDKVRAFLQTLVHHGAACTLEYGDGHVRFSDSGQVENSLARLSRENLRAEEQWHDGALQGVLPTARAFELRLGDGQIVRGKIAPAIADAGALNARLQLPVRVRLAVTRVGTGRPRYVLLEVT